jgi:xanthine dehydrogenase molybdopterin-binding subunit B
MSHLSKTGLVGSVLSKMVDECWNKLQLDCISLDELNAFATALDLFTEVDTSVEHNLISQRIESLTRSPSLARRAEQRSFEYDECRAVEDAENQTCLENYPEAEESDA